MKHLLLLCCCLLLAGTAFAQTTFDNDLILGEQIYYDGNSDQIHLRFTYPVTYNNQPDLGGRGCVIFCGTGLYPVMPQAALVQLIDLQGNLLFEELAEVQADSQHDMEDGEASADYYGGYGVQYFSQLGIDMASYNNGLYTVLIRMGGETIYKKIYIRNKGTGY